MAANIVEANFCALPKIGQMHHKSQIKSRFPNKSLLDKQVYLLILMILKLLVSAKHELLMNKMLNSLGLNIM